MSAEAAPRAAVRGEHAPPLGGGGAGAVPPTRLDAPRGTHQGEQPRERSATAAAQDGQRPLGRSAALDHRGRARREGGGGTRHGRGGRRRGPRGRRRRGAGMPGEAVGLVRVQALGDDPQGHRRRPTVHGAGGAWEARFGGRGGVRWAHHVPRSSKIGCDRSRSIFTYVPCRRKDGRMCVRRRRASWSSEGGDGTCGGRRAEPGSRRRGWPTAG